jgi:hypothetical protein
MKNVIEFPKLITSEIQAEPVSRASSAKVLDFADWTRDPSIQFADMMVDAWPFCAA